MNELRLTVNGAQCTAQVEPRTHLADFLRETLNLTGTHTGCEHGICGACTLLVDGKPVRSCITYAIMCQGSDVRTIEGFDEDPAMALLRAAFTRHHALQCGYCTPGMLATAYDIVARLPDADEARIREELAGNLCRCTGYAGIVAAIQEVQAVGPHRPPHHALYHDPGRSKADAVAVAAIPSKTAALQPAVAAIEGGVSLTRVVIVDAPIDRLWLTLNDVPTVARCLPGSSLEAILPGGEAVGELIVAIGPMRARFRGRARFAFDAAARRGELRGSGSDGLSRSGADGLIRFSVEPASADQSRLSLEITYRISGPLAQFSRPALVADIVERMLARFADNLAGAAAGKAIVEGAPLPGIRLIIDAMLASLRRMFRR